MWRFRPRSRPTEDFEPLTVRYDPPPDGSYPPRLLTPLSSIWLADEETITPMPEFSLRRSGNQTRLTLNDGAEKLRLNGQPLYQPITLNDGDFLYLDDTRTLIYQADPVAERKRWVARYREAYPATITPSAKLRQQIDLNAEGIALGNQPRIRWEQLMSLEWLLSDSFGGAVGDIVLYQAQADKVKGSLRLSKQDYDDLWIWLLFGLPVDVSAYDTRHHYGGVIRENLPDAYRAATYFKIFEPAQQGKRDLPASEDVIFGFHSVTQGGRLIMWFAVGLLALGLIFALVTGNAGLRDIVLGVSFLFSIAMLPALAQSIKGWRRRQHLKHST